MGTLNKYKRPPPPLTLHPFHFVIDATRGHVVGVFWYLPKLLVFFLQFELFLVFLQHSFVLFKLKSRDVGVPLLELICF